MHIFSVRAAGNKTEGQDGAARRTLGDLLYTNRGKVYATEDDWVKLVQSIAAGDQVALHSLYQQTHRIVFTLIVRITNNPETAEELTVDVFHEVWRRAPDYDPAAGPVVGWIMNQARSRAIDRVRYEHRKKRTNLFGEPPLTAVAPGTEYPPHRHAGIEELYLLQGELMIDDKKVCPGDYIRAEADSVDHRVWSETGCTCVLLTSTQDELLL